MSLRFEKIMDEREAAQMNALQLAYLGDSVWELIIRYKLIIQNYNVKHMHQKCVECVNAHAQSQILQSIEELLTDTEREIVRRGRNSHAKHPVPRNQNPEDYALATGFEALIGFLYLTGNNDRICNLVHSINEVMNNG